MRGPTKEINATYKRNYPRQQIACTKGSKTSVDGVCTFFGFQSGKLTYDVSCLPEDDAEEVDSAGDTDKAQRYRQPLYL